MPSFSLKSGEAEGECLRVSCQAGCEGRRVAFAYTSSARLASGAPLDPVGLGHAGTRPPQLGVPSWGPL